MNAGMFSGLTAYVNGLFEKLDVVLAGFLPGETVFGFIAYGVYILIILAGASLAVLSTNLIRALMGLVLTFIGVAGMYLLLASPFMAFMQLLIYVGAICIIIFFALMLVDNSATGEESNFPSLKNVLNGFLAAGIMFAFFGSVILFNTGDEKYNQALVESNVADIGQALIEKYVFAFELISVILVVAMAGGVMLAWRKRGAKNNDN